ncbi:MAG: hypothetical protein HYX86_03635 [Chloroflexi bacterium]|nr:hypothetical protein [Chloroflexota bacterium]
MRSFFLLLGIFLAVALAGCTSLKSDDNAQSYYQYNQELPLSVGNYWTYRVTRYEGFNPNDMMTATSMITDTIIGIEVKEEFFIATVQSVQSEEVLVEVRGKYPVANALRTATTTNYWLIVDGNRVLRQDDRLDLSDLQTRVLVEFVFPVILNSEWSIFNAKDAPLNRKVASIGSITVPAGEFTDCFFLETGAFAGTTIEDWFCPGIGLVWNNSEHHGTPYGGRTELVSYRVK